MPTCCHRLHAALVILCGAFTMFLLFNATPAFAQVNVGSITTLAPANPALNDPASGGLTMVECGEEEECTERPANIHIGTGLFCQMYDFDTDAAIPGITYRWVRYSLFAPGDEDPSNVNPAAVPGQIAAGQNYTVRPEDIALGVVRCVAMFPTESTEPEDAGRYDVFPSDQFFTAYAIAPDITTETQVTGDTLAGSALTCAHGAITGDGPVSSVYTWKVNGAVIAGATVGAMSSTVAQINKTITCDLAVSSPYGADSATSTPFGPVTRIPMEQPVLAGDNRVNGVLTCNVNLPAGYVPASYTWKSPRGSIGTGSMYKVLIADAKTNIYCEVVAKQDIDEVTLNSQGMTIKEYTWSDNCTVRGTEGDDVIVAENSQGAQLICGFGGNDTITGTTGNDIIVGGSGNDIVHAGDGVDIVYGDLPDETIGYPLGANVVAVAGNDEIHGNGGDDTILGMAGDDRLYGEDGVDTISGMEGNDHLDGGSGNDLLHGMEGNDHLEGGAGMDRLLGSIGDDALLGGIEDDALVGGEGDDSLNGEAGNDLLYGGEGDDKMQGSDGDDRLYGGEGDDIVSGGLGNDKAFGMDGEDTVVGGEGDDSVSGGLDADTLAGGGGDDIVAGGDDDDEVRGNAGADVLRGNDGDDNMQGGSGPDNIVGMEGDDTISGGSGEDKISGGSGEDILNGNTGKDIFSGGPGNDEITGGGSADRISGNEGDDKIKGSGGDDLIRGDNGRDTISGNSGDDIILGGLGNDKIFGNTGDDRISGTIRLIPVPIIFDMDLDQRTELTLELEKINDGRDSIAGGAGDDILMGGTKEDRIDGGDGGDVIYGGAGDDRMRGGSGMDIFYNSPGCDDWDGETGYDFLINIAYLNTSGC